MVWVILIAVLVLLVLTAAVSVLVFYVMFRRSDSGRWQLDVLDAELREPATSRRSGADGVRSPPESQDRGAP